MLALFYTFLVFIYCYLLFNLGYTVSKKKLQNIYNMWTVHIEFWYTFMHKYMHFIEYTLCANTEGCGIFPAFAYFLQTYCPGPGGLQSQTSVREGWWTLLMECNSNIIAVSLLFQLIVIIMYIIISIHQYRQATAASN